VASAPGVAEGARAAVSCGVRQSSDAMTCLMFVYSSME
jgi:hypothetical protein